MHARLSSSSFQAFRVQLSYCRKARSLSSWRNTKKSNAVSVSRLAFQCATVEFNYVKVAFSHDWNEQPCHFFVQNKLCVCRSRQVQLNMLIIRSRCVLLLVFPDKLFLGYSNAWFAKHKLSISIQWAAFYIKHQRGRWRNSCSQFSPAWKNKEIS